MPYRIRIDGRDTDAEIVARRPQLLLRVGPSLHSVADAGLDGSEFDLTVDGVRYRGWRYALGNEVHVRLEGRTYIVQVGGGAAEAVGASSQEEIRASMPGVVVAVHSEPGQAVKAGDQLLTMESMKLQVTLVASHDATVERIHVAPQGVFERGALLVSFIQRKAG